MGDRVTHDTYGMGSVLEVEEGRAVVVDFGTRTARIVTPYPKLFKL